MEYPPILTFCRLVIHYSPSTSRCELTREWMSAEVTRGRQIILQTFLAWSVCPALRRRHALRVQVVIRFSVEWTNMGSNSTEWKYLVHLPIHKIQWKQRTNTASNNKRTFSNIAWQRTRRFFFFKFSSLLHQKLCQSLRCERQSRIHRIVILPPFFCINYKLRLNFPANGYLFHNAIDAITVNLSTYNVDIRFVIHLGKNEEITAVDSLHLDQRDFDRSQHDHETHN